MSFFVFPKERTCLCNPCSISMVSQSAKGTFKEVRTKTPVGGNAPTAPHTAWQTMRPKVSRLLSKG